MIVNQSETEIAPDEVAVVFGPSGLRFMLPNFADEANLSDYVLAATEAFLRAQDEGIDALARAFERRSRC